jgi:hypothetical protein
MIDILAKEYIKFADEDLAKFESVDLMTLLALLSRTFNKLKQTIDDIKEIEDTDRVSIYFLLLGVVIDKSVSASNLTEDEKEQVRIAFGEDGIYQTLLGMFSDMLNQKLQEMDVNKDNKVTKSEYTSYMYKTNMKYCGCMGKAANLKAAVNSANCCFPFLSGGEDVIDLSQVVELEEDEK